MESTSLIYIGIGLIVLAIILFAISIIYPKTFGKKVMYDLNREYDIK